MSARRAEPPRAGFSPRRRQHGLSMVELLVGAAIGLFIAATGATLLAGNLRENRSLLMETRLMQDLRTAADVVSRDLRRAGYWSTASNGVWSPGASGVAANPHVALVPSAAASDAISFRYSRDAAESSAGDGNDQFAFRLSHGAIELKIGAGTWQALTDVNTLTVTAFNVAPRVQEVSLEDACASPCPAGSGGSCPPRQQVRSVDVLISGRATGDATVARSVRSSVRLRNDAVLGACPA